ncbi:MAG: hypothetical protein IJ087_05685, partial [Eggerthellaceae bacterium]|nr:hypothetical protein [Eggerthellaceae bacterium]
MTIGMKTRRFVAFIAAIALVVSTIAIPAGEAHAALNLQVASLQAQSRSADDLSAQSVSGFSVFGADVSQWQGSVNWKKASSTLKFAIVRCGYGDNLRYQDDTRWLENAQKCRANGIPMGVYLYSYATNTTMAKSEANHVIRCLKEAGLNAKSLQLPIYLDMEDPSTLGLSAGEYANIFTTFKNRLVAHGYSNVGVYANLDWWGNRLYGVQLPSEMRWIAQWSNEPSDKNCGIWQYTDAVTVSGFAYPIDGDLARSDLPFLKSAPASPAAPKKNNTTKATPSVFALRN